jgi:hypothetical protein
MADPNEGAPAPPHADVIIDQPETANNTKTMVVCIDLSSSTDTCSVLDADVVAAAVGGLPDDGFDNSKFLCIESTSVLKREVYTALRYAHLRGVKKVHVIGYSGPNGFRNKPGNAAAGIPVGAVLELAPFNVNNPDALVAWCEKYKAGETCPHIAVQALMNAAPQWLKDQATTEVVFVCDGQIGALTHGINADASFQEEIGKLTVKNPDCRVTILSVSDKDRNFNGEAGVAGIKIFEALGGAGATRVSFYGYAPNHPLGVELYKSREVPEGYVPYGSKMFKLQDERTFFEYMITVLHDATDDNIMDIMRNMVAAVSHFIKISSPSEFEIKTILNTYRSLCDLCTKLEDEDVLELKELFDNMTKMELAGKIQSAVAYSADKKTRFAAATQRLITDVPTALGSRSDDFMTFPMQKDDGSLVLYTVCRWDITGTFDVRDKNKSIKYANGAFTDSTGKKAPVFARHFRATPAAEQGQRQFARAAASHETGIDCRSDQTLVFLLCRAMQIINTPTDIDPQLREAYQRLMISLLKKTCAGSERVEYDSLRDGRFYSGRTFKTDLPIGFKRAFGTDANWEHIWYAICRSLGDELLLGNQLRLLKMRTDDVEAIFAKIVAQCPPVEVIDVPPRSNLVHDCMITGEDTSEGGWIIASHNGCTPEWVFSADAKVGFDGTTMGPTFSCPKCRNHVPKTLFEETGPKPPGIEIKFPDCAITKPPTAGYVHAKAAPAPPIVADGGRKIAINLRGTVGGGKSSTRAELVTFFTKLGYKVHVGSPDDINKRGRNPRAGDIVRDDIYKAMGQPGNVVIIIDTCGERAGAPFGIHFSAPWELFHITPNFPWKTTFCSDYTKQLTPQQYCSAATSSADIKDYSKRALTAVLARGPSSAHTPYWLNKHGAGDATCRKVHNDKTNALFGGAAKVANGESLVTPPWLTTITEQVAHFMGTIVLAIKFQPAHQPVVPAWGGAGVPNQAAPAPQQKIRSAAIRVYGSNAADGIAQITAAVEAVGWKVETNMTTFTPREKVVLVNQHKRTMTKGDNSTLRRKVHTDQTAIDDEFIAKLLADLKIV